MRTTRPVRVRRVKPIVVPYHLDEQLAHLAVPLPEGAAVEEITTRLSEGDAWVRLSALYEVVAARVAAASRRGERCVVFSGDCTTSLGIVAGLQRGGVHPGVVWFDAHGDVQTPETTTSGYLGGMPLRLMMGYRPELLADRLGLHAVPEHEVLLVDARDLDPPEVDYLAEAPVGRAQVAEVVADVLPERPLYVHVDLDVVDPEALPGLRFPATDGPSLDAVVAALDRVLDTGRVAALGLGCTWWPGEDGEQASARARGALKPLLTNLLAAGN
jgi:arginase